MSMEIIGYFCAMLVGVSLGTLGSGGSILTVPIMVYLMHVNPVDATGYSLFVVGITSAIGTGTFIRKDLVDIKTAVIFAIPSIISVFLTRKFLIPAIPNPVITVSSFVVSKELFIMLFFALLMMVVAYTMIRNDDLKDIEEIEIRQPDYSWLKFIGFVSGILTGLTGAGGGFIIIPALVLFAKVSIRTSVGTSLLIITANSFIGFGGELLTKHEVIDYKFLFAFAFFSVIGIFIGLRLSLKITATQLKKTFGWFILITGIYVFVKEFFFR
ncbi:MAG TPA: sulfite exporter TauE/SafE family protein [Bacteroidia bacterium]|nr:sulfite exporter TauE/SafE family protein [Bacteroidia bacterium]